MDAITVNRRCRGSDLRGSTLRPAAAENTEISTINVAKYGHPMTRNVSNCHAEAMLREASPAAQWLGIV